MSEMNEEWRAALNEWAAEIRRQEEERNRKRILKLLRRSRAEKQRQYYARQVIIDELKSKIFNR